MSAPALIDQLALELGTAELDFAAIERSHGETTRLRGERRRTNPLALLSRRHDRLCTRAVDVLEIAAGLETAGVNDRVARRDYGAGSVFELAGRLFELVPSRPRQGPVPLDPWLHPMRQHLLRGVLYALPGLLLLGALRYLQPGPAAATLLLAAAVLANGLSQGVSVLGHLLLGRGDDRAARRLFVVAMVAGAACLGPIAALGAAPQIGPAGLLAGAQLEYVLAATVLLVLRAERLLLVLLTPGAVLSSLALAGALDPQAAPALLGLVAVTVVAAVVSALVRAGQKAPTRDAARAPGLRGCLGRVELGAAVAHTTTGLLAGGLLAFVPIDVLTGQVRGSSALLLATMLPLTASLGVADLLVHRLRSRAVAVSRGQRSPRDFRRWAARALAGAAAVQLGVLLALSALLLAGLTATGRSPGREQLLYTAGYAALGVTLLVVSLLLSMGRPWVAVAVLGPALLVDAALRAPAAHAGPQALAWFHLGVWTVTVASATLMTGTQFRRVSLHR